MSLDVEINGFNFRVGKLNAMVQLHVARRVLPIMGALVGLMQSGAAEAITAENALPAMAEQIAGMPDADVDYVVQACLRVVQRENDKGGWSAVMTPSGQLMFEEIDMMVMLQLVGAVVKENLGGFFSGIGPSSQEVTTSPET